jgi:hypothetical protein
MAKDKPSLKRKVINAGGWNIAKRVAKAIPYVGTVMAVGLVGYNVRKKGLVRGVVDSGLDAIPFVGTAKNVTEFFTGDLIPAKERKIDERIRENNENDESSKKS